MDEQGQHVRFTATDIREMKVYSDAHRTLTTPFDIVVEGKTPGDEPDRAAVITREWAAAGATWWIEALWGDPDQPVDLDCVLQRIHQGPPRFV
jgi:hypothetical protein